MRDRVADAQPGDGGGVHAGTVRRRSGPPVSRDARDRVGEAGASVCAGIPRDPAIAGWSARRRRVGERSAHVRSSQIRDARGARARRRLRAARPLARLRRPRRAAALARRRRARPTAGLRSARSPSDRLVGFSFALPAASRRAVLVRPRGRPRVRAGVASGGGSSSPSASGRWPRASRVIRWTADPLSAPALALYLGRLGRAARRLRARSSTRAVRPRGGPARRRRDRVAARRGPRPSRAARGTRRDPARPRRAASAKPLSRWRHRRPARDDGRAGGRRASGPTSRVDRGAGRAWVLFREAA